MKFIITIPCCSPPRLTLYKGPPAININNKLRVTTSIKTNNLTKMVQANRANIQVQLSVDLSALNKESVTKPVAASDFAALLGEAKAYGAANGVK